MLATSRTSSWVVPPPKVAFYREAPEAERSERLQCASAEWAVGTSTSRRGPSTGFGGVRVKVRARARIRARRRELVTWLVWIGVMA